MPRGLARWKIRCLPPTDFGLLANDPVRELFKGQGDNEVQARRSALRPANDGLALEPVQAHPDLLARLDERRNGLDAALGYVLHVDGQPTVANYKFGLAFDLQARSSIDLSFDELPSEVRKHPLYIHRLIELNADVLVLAPDERPLDDLVRAELHRNRQPLLTAGVDLASHTAGREVAQKTEAGKLLRFNEDGAED